jgi:hypothetical protein
MSVLYNRHKGVTSTQPWRIGRKDRGAAFWRPDCVDRDGVDIGRYDDSEIHRQARKLALATAERVFRTT